MAKKKSTRKRKVAPKKKFSLFPVVVVGLILVIVAVGAFIVMRDEPEPVNQEPVAEVPANVTDVVDPVPANVTDVVDPIPANVTDVVDPIPAEAKKVILETNFGEIEIELFPAKAPRTVENFLTLAGDGFYDGTRFHRVIEGFMIQGGCPHSADEALKAQWGTGGPGHMFDCEIHDENFNVRGTIAMANAGPNTNGSQFFISVVDNNFLDPRHTVFGRVVSGMDIVDKISAVETGPRDVPVEEVVLQRVVIVQ